MQKCIGFFLFAPSKPSQSAANEMREVNVRWLHALLALATALLVVSAAFIGGSWWLASRPADPVSAESIEHHRALAMQWLRRHEQDALADANVALWWMIQRAAQHSGDPYLHQLTQQAIAHHFDGPFAQEPWRRMLEPRAEILAFARGLEKLVDYQRFFHHAMTCKALPLANGDTERFLRGDMCAPMWREVFWRDPVCTTHQVFGQMLYQQTGCPPVGRQDQLQQQLLDDVELQLTWDPVMRDPHIQRVLVLVMNSRAAHVKPIWLQRILAAQEADGGWRGYRRIPELPEWMQPWVWRDQLGRWWPDRFPSDRRDFDFHASAQAILLLTLLQPPAGHPHAQVEPMTPTMP